MASRHKKRWGGKEVQLEIGKRQANRKPGLQGDAGPTMGLEGEKRNVGTALTKKEN